MSARSISQATVSFGLVSIPVKIYSTSDNSNAISLNQVHEKCGTRIKQQLYCPTDDEVVSRDELVKGYEFTKGQFVTFSKEELESLTPKSSQTIEIIEFVPIDQVDPIYFDNSLYLGPNTGGERPYKLLAQVMVETGRCALAKYASRGKDSVVLLRPFEEGVILQQLRWPEEIRGFDEVPVGSPEVSEAEVDLAKKIVEQISVEQFEPEQFENKVTARLRQMVEQKIEGKDVTIAPAEEPKAQIVDLMEALKASLEQADDRKPAQRADDTETGTEEEKATGTGAS